MINEDYVARQKRHQRNFLMMKLAITTAAIIVAMMCVANPIRLDFAGGNHRIIPTAVDTDFWGNYKVYYKTTDFTHNRSEDLYYIEKGQYQLVEQMNQAIIDGKEVVVFYDQYLGWKGFTAPKTSPIIKVEAAKGDSHGK